MRAVTAAVSLVLVLGLAGCGERSTPKQPGVQPPELSTSSSAPVKPSPDSEKKTLSGTVADGVEAGCTTLTTDEGVFLLLGADVATLTSGAKVEVTGRVSTDVASICQQGTPFMVEQVRPG